MKIGQFLGEPEPLWCQLNGGLPDFNLETPTALLIVDMLHSGAARGQGGKWVLAAERGVAHELEYYNQRLGMVIRNLQRLMETFRAKNMEVIHGVSHSYAKDGRDRKRPFTLKPQLWPRATWWDSTEESRIIPELQPRPDEIVIPKTGTTFFGTSDIDRVLTNLGIENLVIGGVITNQCVESTVRGASAYGYNVVLVEDACATHSEQLHKASLRALGDWCCKVRTTDDVMEEIMSL